MPSPVDLNAKRKKLRLLQLDHLQLRGPISRRGRYLLIAGHCQLCGKTRLYLTNNLEQGRTTRCRCQRPMKYRGNPLAKIFGQRYDVIRQRCRNRSYPAYARYGGQGIRCRFKDRESFIRYMLALAAKQRPEITTVKQLRNYEIERINNARHFAKRNLRLGKTTD